MNQRNTIQDILDGVKEKNKSNTERFGEWIGGLIGGMIVTAIVAASMVAIWNYMIANHLGIPTQNFYVVYGFSLIIQLIKFIIK